MLQNLLKTQTYLKKKLENNKLEIIEFLFMYYKHISTGSDEFRNVLNFKANLQGIYKRAEIFKFYKGNISFKISV